MQFIKFNSRKRATTNLPGAKTDDGHFDAIGQSNVSVGSRHLRLLKRTRTDEGNFERFELNSKIE
jgi:hypothetical protein